MPLGVHEIRLEVSRLDPGAQAGCLGMPEHHQSGFSVPRYDASSRAHSHKHFYRSTVRTVLVLRTVRAVGHGHHLAASATPVDPNLGSIRGEHFLRVLPRVIVTGWQNPMHRSQFEKEPLVHYGLLSQNVSTGQCPCRNGTDQGGNCNELPSRLRLFQHVWPLLFCPRPGLQPYRLGLVYRSMRGVTAFIRRIAKLTPSG